MQSAGKKPSTGRRTSSESKQRMSRKQSKAERCDDLSSSEKALAERLSEIKGRIECFLDEDDVKKILDVVSERPLWLGANGDRIAKLLKLEYRFSERLAIDASLVIEQTAPVSADQVSPKPPVKKDESSEDDDEGDDDSDDEEGSSEEDSDGEVTCFEGGHSVHEAKVCPAHSKTNVNPKTTRGSNAGKRSSDVQPQKSSKMKSKVPSSSEEDSSSYESSSDEEQPRKPAKEVIRKAPAKAKAGEEDSSSDESDSYEKPKSKKTKLQVSANVIHKTKDENYTASAAANVYDEEDDDTFIIRNPSVNEIKEKNKQPFASTPSSSSGGSRTIYVKNLAWGVDEGSVVAYFQTAGDVKEVRLAREQNGRFRGYGYIEFYTEEAAKRACRKSGGTFYGREIYVDIATDRVCLPSSEGQGRRDSGTPRSGNGADQSFCSQATAYVTGFDKYLDENTIHTSLVDLFRDCGVKSVRIPKHVDSGHVKGFALIEFKDKHGLSKAIQKNSSDFYGRLLVVREDETVASPESAKDGCRGGRGRGHGRRGGRGYPGQ